MPMIDDRRQPRRRAGGFTLIEVLVAMGIFVVLGTALVIILRQGLHLWRTGEARKEVHERANFILSYLREDLSSTYSGTWGPSPVRFLCDLEPASQERGARRQRLRFVRTRKGESQHPLASLGGTVIESTEFFDHFGDVDEARQGTLRAGGGLEEVIYFLDPDLDDTTLWRGIRSPPGGIDSFLDPAMDRAWNIEDRCRELATGVLYIEFRFWTQYTNTWDESFYPRLFPHKEDERSGPALLWDSTRGLFVPGAGKDPPERVFEMFVGTGSVGDPSDDIFPRQVMVTLVMETDDGVVLAENIGPDTTRIPIRGASKIPPDAPPYVRIDQEWIRYDKREKGRLVLDEAGGGRGTRWTWPRPHRAGAPVSVGRTFTLIVRIPAFRDDW